MSRRVILDTSVLVSAALRPESIPHQALQEALAVCAVCASAETLAELERILSLEKFNRYLNRTLCLEFVALIRRHIHLFTVQDSDFEAVNPPCRDPGDNKFLALAIAAEADALVSSDDDLLVLHPWRGMKIVTPADFLAHSKALPRKSAESK
ncbi:putative toxin-antitoxin system toxin component, PIN family [Paracidobacterium acidisoli]|uniref:putative toxin-antitoxin system toxin component, PIN family n=1 Tax=Paracidobacterium acidisoli TaxID=2303751 RepID=UPI0018F24A42|nr:putative toxin-antitoxin system toxin component, PIN family [Paracidobacterium acidisoli]